MDVLEKVQTIIAAQLNIDPKSIQEESRLMDDLKADSLDIVELVMDIEHEFDIQVIEEDMPEVLLVKDIIAYIHDSYKEATA